MKLLALLILVSCQSFPQKDRKLVFEQCGVIHAYENVEISRDGAPSAELIIDMRKSTCRCRRYKYSLVFVGPIADSSQDRPIEYCDRLIGSNPENYKAVTDFIQDLRADLDRARK